MIIPLSSRILDPNYPKLAGIQRIYKTNGGVQIFPRLTLHQPKDF